MEQTSSFQDLFNAALQEYENQTRTSLIDHPFIKRLESCHSVDSITAILQEQAQIFQKFRGDDGELMKSLRNSVNILYPLSISTAGVGLPSPPVNAIFAGIAILLSAVKDVSASYDALIDLFASFENFLSRLSIYTGVPPTSALTNILVKIMVELLSTLALATKQVKQGRLKKFMKKLRGENDIEATLQRLDRLTLDEARATAAQTLEVVYGLVRHRKVVMDEDDGNELVAGISSALESTQEIVSKMNKAERDKLLRDVRRWLSPPDPWTNHNLARESRHSGTGTWWIRGDAYAKWKSSGPNSLLWIHGKPGAGKSVICSAIVEDINTLQKYGLASLAFFYFDFRDGQKKDQRGLLSSLLVQLCDQSDAYSAILSDFYVAHGRGTQQASDSELVGCLKGMLKLPGQPKAHIIIDALDECPITTGLPSPRGKVLKLVEELVNLRIPNLRICVTSRPEADIIPILEPLSFHSVSLHAETGQVQDIAEYVRSVIYTGVEMQRWKDTDKKLVIDVLTKKADGMFRWVFCQLVYLRRCIPGRIRRALDELPKTLDETYARSLEEIDEQNWEYAHRLFQCVAAASRPLRVDELAEFLAFDFETGSTPTFLADWRPEDPAHTVLSVCSSLLTIVESELRDINGSPFPPVIQFAHYSVKEYLMSARLAKTNNIISHFHVSMTAAHTIVSQACLAVLLHVDDNVTEDSLEDFPLANYAAEHCVGHARIEDVSSKVQDEMERLFDPNGCHFSVWVWICDPERPWRKRYERPGNTRATPLHYAAFCGMHDIAAFLIVKHSQDVSARGFDDDETPLHVSSRCGHSDIAQLLLEHGADAKAQDGHKRLPLHLASASGHAEVAQVLLDHGVDANAQDDYKTTPLHEASEGGHVEAARVLLDHGADAKAEDGDKSTPLHGASDCGHADVARILLDHGADAKAQNINDSTPLHWASNRGHVDVVQVLLDHSADADAQDDYKATPLHRASGGGHVDAARVLLGHGADANAQSNDKSTPLHWASEGGHVDVVRVLLDHGADANARNNDKNTPLHRASDRGHVDVARVLLDRGADTDARNNAGCSPLGQAVDEEHMEVAQVLLGYGADAKALDNKNRSLVYRAGGEEAARFLLEHGADANSLDINGRTALYHASKHGYVGVARALLKHGVDANARDAKNETPLHLVSGLVGRQDVARLLLQYGADIHARDDEGRTPFMIATAQEKHDMVRLLLEYGAEARDHGERY